MKTYRCIIVDDEPLAHTVLEKHISAIPSLELVQKCFNAFDALAYLQTHAVDIMFLDIRMPDFTGLEMLKTLNHQPHVIITTAYTEYAVESYEYTVSDYLLKPISFERFLKAINKLDLKSDPKKQAESKDEETEDFIFIKSDKATHQIKFDDIIYLQSYGNYIKIFTTNNMHMIYESMANFEKKLPDNFIRVHKSYILPISKIQKIDGNTIHTQAGEVPIGKTFKAALFNRLEK